MKYTKDFGRLGLPEYFKFGIELEADNVKTKGNDSLYTGESARYIEEINWHMATKKEESLVGKGGAELVSPILKDTEKTWRDIADICKQIKKYPGHKGEKVEANEKCGLHVHFDAECLAKDPQKMKRFLRIYAESEELIYKMCNDKNDSMRKDAIHKKLKGLNLVSSLWRNGMAAPSSKKILEKIEDGKLKVSYKKWGKFRSIAGKYKIDERRYKGLNLTNIGNEKKNTIEFRMANGTLEPEVIKQNVFLYASLINTAIQSVEDPEKYYNKMEKFLNTNVSEKEKAENFLELIMENSEDREIYLDRWESVKDNKVFQGNPQRKFAEGRFKREEFKEILERVPAYNVRKAYNNMKNAIQNTKEQGANIDYVR